jgi:hypothetical protein
MEQKKLHPSVLKFREFVKNNPGVLSEVKSGKTSLQDLYEEWYLLGEEDERWQQFKQTGDSTESDEKKNSGGEKKSEWMGQIANMAKKMDPVQMQVFINNASQALGAIQGLLSQFQGSGQINQPGPSKPAEGPKHPFHFRKD